MLSTLCQRLHPPGARTQAGAPPPHPPGRAAALPRRMGLFTGGNFICRNSSWAGRGDVGRSLSAPASQGNVNTGGEMAPGHPCRPRCRGSRRAPGGFGTPGRGGLGTLRGPAVLHPLAIAAARGLIRRQRCSAWPGRASEPRCPFTPPGEVCPPRVYFLPRDGQDLPHACTPGGAPRTQGDQKGRIARGLWDEFSKSHGGVLPRWRSRRFTNAPPLGRQGGICASGSGPNRGCWGGALPHGSPRSRFRRQRGDNVRHMRMMKGFAARGENR